ncbi:phosphopantetheine-binding protein, partial [Cohnella silvisoli]
AYVVADRECTSGELRRHCGERLPEYMIPASFTQLEAMPLTASGKTNRKALPAPEASMATGTAYAAPGNETEEKLVGIWQELLQRETVGIDDNFFELGGNSLLVLRMHKTLEQQQGGSLNVTDLFAYPTISKLAGYIQRESSATSASSRISVVPIQLPSQWMPADRRYRTGDYLRMPLSSSTVQYLEQLAELEGVDPGLPAIGVWIVMLAQTFRQSRYDLPICGFGGGASVVKLDLNEIGGFSELIAYLRSALLHEHTSNSNSLPVLANEQNPDSSIIPLLCGGTAPPVPEGWRPLADLTIVVQSTGFEWAIQVEYNAGKIRKDKIKDLMKDFPIWCRRMANERQSKEQSAVSQDVDAEQERKGPR